MLSDEVCAILLDVLVCLVVSLDVTCHQLHSGEISIRHELLQFVDGGIFNLVALAEGHCMPCRSRDIVVRGSWRLCVISWRCCCAYRQSGSDTEKRYHVAITAVHHAMQKVPRAVRRAASQVCEKSGRWWPGGPDASSRGGARACHMCPHGTAVRCTRFSSCDARRNLTQAAKSGVRLLFLRSRDRRASKCFRQRRRMQPKSFLFTLRSVIVGVFCVHAASTLR